MKMSEDIGGFPGDFMDKRGQRELLWNNLRRPRLPVLSTRWRSIRNLEWTHHPVCPGARGLGRAGLGRGQLTDRVAVQNGKRKRKRAR